MPAYLLFPLAIVAAYLLGSVPFAIISSKIFGLADPRSYGSKNPGATNVLRSGNKLAALLTLIGESAKGAVAVLIAQYYGGTMASGQALIVVVALAVFFGHLYPLFLGFKGGKGVATAAGILLAIDPLLGLVTLATWLSIAHLPLLLPVGSGRGDGGSGQRRADVGCRHAPVGRRHHRLHPDRQTLAKPATPDGRHRTENRRQEEGRVGAFRIAAASVA